MENKKTPSYLSFTQKAKKIKGIAVALIAMLFLSFSASAHVWEIRVNQNQDGSLTWYLQSWHQPNEQACFTNLSSSGLTINGINYPIQSTGTGSIESLSATVFGVNTQYTINRLLYGVINTPFLGTTLSVQPYSNVACWDTPPGFVSTGNFTPPPPPICSTCPLLSASNTVVLPGNDNGTPCDPTDDYAVATVDINHLACASITGDSAFSLVLDPAGLNISYGPFAYSTGVTTSVNINLPYGASDGSVLEVVDADFPCTVSETLSLPGGTYLGEVDAIPPTIACPSTILQSADSGICGAIVNFAASAFDNCGTPSVSYSQDPGTVFNVGITSVTAIAMDAAGNVDSCSFNVLVTDDEDPIITGPASSTQMSSLTECGALVNYSVSATDNCPGALVVQSAGLPSGSLFPVGVTTNTFTAFDVNGNSASYSFDVTVTQNPASTLVYTILSKEDVHMHYNNVYGNVGVWKSDKKAKLHEFTNVYGYVTADEIELKDSSVVYGAMNLMQAPTPDPSTFKSNTMSGGTNVSVPDNYVGVYSIVGTNFKKIEIGKNSSAQFASSGDIYIEELKTEDGDVGMNTTVTFSGNTDLIIKKKMELKKRTLFNQGSGYEVNVYVEEDDVKVKEYSVVEANIDVRYKDLEIEGKDDQYTVMTGRYIAKKVDAKDYVEWNGTGCSGATNPNPNNRPNVGTEKSVHDLVAGLNATIFPNPNNGQFTIEVKSMIEGPVSAEIYDITGKKVTTLLGMETNNEYLVNEKLSNGVYFIELQLDDQKESIKFIKKD